MTKPELNIIIDMLRQLLYVVRKIQKTEKEGYFFSAECRIVRLASILVDELTAIRNVVN